MNAPDEDSRYHPLREYLEARREMPRVRLTFEEIRVISGLLPPSAFKLPEWWANEFDPTGRPQAAAWLGAGFAVETVNRNQGWVEFVRNR